jgi:hypothetical protein
MNRKLYRTFAVLLPIVALIGFGLSVESFPRLAAAQALPCQTCHINPAGGGMRNEFGNHAVALNELCLPQTKKLFKDRYRSPRLSESVTFGFDIRYLVFDDGTIFRMQTDAYFMVEPLKDLQYQFRVWEGGISENFGLLWLNDRQFHVKVGRFMPAYGLRMSDHKSYVRDRIGLGANVYRDGLSLGAQFHGVELTTEYFSVPGRKLFGGHLYYPGVLPPFTYLLGASVQIPEELSGSTGGFPLSRAVFGGLSYDRLTLLGELDMAGKANDTLITYAQLTTRLEYGAYLIAEYNFFDGNRDLETGVDEYLRISFELYPLPFVQLRPSYTYYLDGLRKDQDDFFVLFHIGY